MKVWCRFVLGARPRHGAAEGREGGKARQKEKEEIRKQTDQIRATADTEERKDR